MKKKEGKKEMEEYGREAIEKGINKEREEHRECVAFLLAARTLHPLVLVTRW